jgi:hypothetical protein
MYSRGRVWELKETFLSVVDITSKEFSLRQIQGCNNSV